MYYEYIKGGTAHILCTFIERLRIKEKNEGISQRLFW